MEKIKNKEALKKTIEKELQKFSKSLITKKEVLEMMEKEVFSNVDYKRHVLEVSKKMELPIEKVDFVLRHYFTTMSIQMALVTRIRRRLSVFAFCMIEIKDKIFDTIWNTEEAYIKAFGVRYTKKIFSIFK